MIETCAFIGSSFWFQDVCQIYPPKVSDVIANPHFSQYLKLLTISQDDIRDELAKDAEKAPTPFEFLLANCYHNKDFENVAREAFQLFLHSEVEFIYTDKKICIGKFEEILPKVETIDQLKFITEENYFDFQNVIRVAVGEKKQKPPEAPNPNEDPRITRMKELARKRDRVKAKQSGANGISIQTCLTAICCMGFGINPLNIGEMSYAAIGPLMKMSQEKEKYDIDVRSLLAGADSKKIKPKYWIRNSDKD